MADVARYPLIPWPRSLEARAGAFALAAGTRISTSDEGNADLRRLAGLLRGYLRELAGVEADIGSGGVIRLALRSDAPAGEEAYRLDLSPERIELVARDARGLFYGVQT